ncbi:MAG: biotin--[acetyl-CoA-carboxylase] ligase [Methanobrevibacter sp.]|uniref:biotin--[acetyl-CoA-carboxylase] ligase n=1 Tax=Methanobrevibacter sp. TaxID=66852 RepID=UPI0026DF0F2F|nr:biotin--[acetyl-CoA-carboxylase] ligase [Methanobrevibacter sp.]MDO5848795.1 biotin--[acetyl-CoA-carboxylase] ligase [Methanobrevibacter sp.]
MRTEIIELLRKEGKLSKNTLSELANYELHDFIDTVKEVGDNQTKYIKKEEILKNLNTEFIGKNIYIFKEVMSTNTVAKFFAEEDDSDGLVIVSEKQTNAKGRTGKPWESPLGGVWLSIILTPHITQNKIPIITLATGVAVEKAFERLGIKNAEIKWPNDVLINDKKVCGILTEAIAKFNTIERVIVGVGIDVNLNVDELPPEIQEGTISLKSITGKIIDENEVIAIFLEEFEKIYELINESKYEEILKEWRKKSYSIGKTVEVRPPFSKSYDAYVVGVDSEGILIVEKTDGTLEKVISGECIIKKQ